MNRRLHIVSFDNPYPPNYGGTIDVYYKMRALHEMGIEIILHCYTYGRKPSVDLESVCKAVYYYPRLKKIIPGIPYIVSSRSNSLLLERLCIDDAPILFEGLHTCYFLNHPKLSGRVRAVRMHNIEHDYYRKLARASTNLFNKIYYLVEAKWLLSFEKQLKFADYVLAISPNDYAELKKQFSHTIHIPPFHENTAVDWHQHSEHFAFYHGNLGVEENNDAALFLVDEVFANINYPLVIAGSNPSKTLRSRVAKFSHIKLHENLNTAEINQLIANAHINVIPTFQDTGIKLKLINVLYKGKHVVANNYMVKNTGCESLVTVADTAEAMRNAIEQLRYQPFVAAEGHRRANVLQQLFDTQKSANKIAETMFSPDAKNNVTS